MTTPLDALVAALRDAADHNPAAEAPPEAIVWCDAGRDFAPALPLLRARLPNLLTFGDYDPATRTGPALWLRAAAARRVSGVSWPENQPPIIHLPSHARDVLRGAEDCPEELAPLVWFAVAGVFFGQGRQGRDWTLRGFLAAQGSPVALDIPDDSVTRVALSRAASRLFAEPVSSLRGRRLDASALDGLLVDDPAADMLAWLDGTLTPEADPERFAAFASLATKQFSFDPRKKSRQDAVSRLARKENGFTKVWHRFAAADGGYDEVVRLLGMEEPQELLTAPDTYPAVNAREEASLRAALLALPGKPRAEAAQAVRELEDRHSWRRATPWARREQAKLAQALQHLAVIAAATDLPQHDAADMATAYVETGWRVDAAALRALDIARHAEEREPVTAALTAIYKPWLEAGAVALQTLAAAGKVPFARPEPPTPPIAGTAILFVDALRMDVAQRLAAVLSARGASVQASWHWSGFPTLTATCKALASPVSGALVAGSADDMLPSYGGKAARKDVLDRAISAGGWALGQTTLVGDEALWTEVGRLDEEGHSLGARLAGRIEEGVEEIARTALRLAKSGRRVRIVTDHGWLLLPGGLPRADLAPGMVAPAGKANRVALLKEGAPSTLTRLPWSWDRAVSYATAPGICAFFAGNEYAHGGVSPQECVLPVLDVAAEAGARQITLTVTWKRLIAKVRAEGGSGLMADIWIGSETSCPSALPKGAKALDDGGEVNLLVDDLHEGKEVCAVLYRADAPGEVIAKLPTRVGG